MQHPRRVEDALTPHPCDCAHGRLSAHSAALNPALIGAGDNAQHSTGRLESSPSGTASWRSGVLISLPCAQSQGPRPPPRSPGPFLTGSAARRFQPALSTCVAVRVSVSAPLDLRLPEQTGQSAAGYAHWPSPSRTHKPFARR